MVSFSLRMSVAVASFGSFCFFHREMARGVPSVVENYSWDVFLLGRRLSF